MAVKLHPFRSRSLASIGLTDDGLLYKSDRRSRVWLVQTVDGPVVIKRFEYTPLRQWLALCASCHPAQRQCRATRRLLKAKVPVAPVVDGGFEACQLGCRVWLSAPFAGQSLQQLLVEDTDDHQRTVAVDAAVRLTCRLIRAGYWFKDLKPSNILVDDQAEAKLIDVGSVRRCRKTGQIQRMLAVMDRVLARDGAGESLRGRYRQAVTEAVGVSQ